MISLPPLLPHSVRQAIVSILKTLRWTFVAVVYTDDNYGVEGSRMLKEEAMRNNICVNASIPIRSGASMDWVVSQLLSARQRAEGESMAVVYIGEKDKAENLIFNVWSLRVGGGTRGSLLLLSSTIVSPFSTRCRFIIKIIFIIIIIIIIIVIIIIIIIIIIIDVVVVVLIMIIITISILVIVITIFGSSSVTWC